MRKIRFFQPKAYVSIDYAAQKLEVWRLVKGDGPQPAIEGGEVPVEHEEPLKRELADFVDAVTTRRAPMVTGEDGRRALALAQQIADKMADANATTRHEGLEGHEVQPKPGLRSVYFVDLPALCFRG